MFFSDRANIPVIIHSVLCFVRSETPMTCRCLEDHPYALGKCDEKNADSSGEEASGNLGVQRHSGMCSDMLKEDTADHSFPEVLGTVPSLGDVVKETGIIFKMNEVETSVDQGGLVHAAGQGSLKVPKMEFFIKPHI